MDSRKPASGRLPPQRSVNVDVELNSTDDIEVVRSSLSDEDAFEIEKERDTGGDPYNSTGQFCIPDFRRKPEK